MQYVLMGAIRDKIMVSLILLVVVGVSLSLFLSSAAIIETDQFALVYTAGSLRLAGVLGVVLFTVFYVRRSFETKDVEFLLTRPISRVSYVVSHGLAFSCIALFMALLVILAVFSVGPHLISEGHFLWATSLIVEFIIMTNVALFFAMVLPSATAGALAAFALYVLARLMGQLLGITEAHFNFTGHDTLSTIFNVVSVIVPRLDLMGQTSWLIYKPSHEVGYMVIVLQLVVYTPLLFAATLMDLVRRQF